MNMMVSINLYKVMLLNKEMVKKEESLTKTEMVLKTMFTKHNGSLIDLESQQSLV